MLKEIKKAAALITAFIVVAVAAQDFWETSARITPFSVYAAEVGNTVREIDNINLKMNSNPLESRTNYYEAISSLLKSGDVISNITFNVTFPRTDAFSFKCGIRDSDLSKDPESNFIEEAGVQHIGGAESITVAITAPEVIDANTIIFFEPYWSGYPADDPNSVITLNSVTADVIGVIDDPTDPTEPPVNPKPTPDPYVGGELIWGDVDLNHEVGLNDAITLLRFVSLEVGAPRENFAKKIADAYNKKLNEGTLTASKTYTDANGGAIELTARDVTAVSNVNQLNDGTAYGLINAADGIAIINKVLDTKVNPFYFNIIDYYKDPANGCANFSDPENPSH